jgi:hypothetical protein
VAATPLAGRQPAIPAYEYGRAPHAMFDAAFGDASATAEADAAQTSVATKKTTWRGVTASGGAERCHPGHRRVRRRFGSLQ